jgi:tRNA G37 N-methylase TrmD
MTRASALISLFPSLDGQREAEDHDLHSEEMLEGLPYRLPGQWLLSDQLPATVNSVRHHSVQAWRAESVFVNLLRSPGIDSQPGATTLFVIPACQAT